MASEEAHTAVESSISQLPHSEIAVWPLLALGAVCILAILYFVYAGKGNNIINSIVVFASLALLLFGSRLVNNVHISPKDTSFAMNGVPEEKEIAGMIMAIIQPFMDETRKSGISINAALKEQNEQVNNRIEALAKQGNAKNIEPVKAPDVSTIKQNVVSQNTPAVLVFYASKDSADLANKIVNTLRDSKKYKSSASFASLGDIVSKEWIKKDKISVAASGDHEALANDIRKSY